MDLEVCNVCSAKKGSGGASLLRCGGCQKVLYCSKDHQKQDWKFHKPQCLLSRNPTSSSAASSSSSSSSSNQSAAVSAPSTSTSSKNVKSSASAPTSSAIVEPDGLNAGECVGTFRWSADKQFERLPPFPPAPPPLTGWRDYVDERFPADDEGKIVVDPAVLDALSYPLSLVYAMKKIGVSPASCSADKFDIVLVGATARAEERIVCDTDYFSEILNYFSLHNSSVKLHLHVVGPEVSTKRHLTTIQLPLLPSITASFYRGEFGEYMQEGSLLLLPSSSVVVGFNPGYGSGFVDLMARWVKDLIALARASVPVIFTCANDYSDLAGETAVLASIVGPNMVLSPQENPFRAVSYFHEPGRRDDSWSCSSSYVYAFRGFPEGRRGPLLDLRPKELKAQLKSLVPVAK